MLKSCKLKKGVFLGLLGFLLVASLFLGSNISKPINVSASTGMGSLTYSNEIFTYSYTGLGECSVSAYFCNAKYTDVSTIISKAYTVRQIYDSANYTDLINFSFTPSPTTTYSVVLEIYFYTDEKVYSPIFHLSPIREHNVTVNYIFKGESRGGVIPVEHGQYADLSVFGADFEEYPFKAWDKDINLPITEDQTFTALYHDFTLSYKNTINDSVKTQTLTYSYNALLKSYVFGFVFPITKDKETVNGYFYKGYTADFDFQLLNVDIFKGYCAVNMSAKKTSGTIIFDYAPPKSSNISFQFMGVYDFACEMNVNFVWDESLNKYSARFAPKDFERFGDAYATAFAMVLLTKSGNTFLYKSASITPDNGVEFTYVVSDKEGYLRLIFPDDFNITKGATVVLGLDAKPKDPIIPPAVKNFWTTFSNWCGSIFRQIGSSLSDILVGLFGSSDIVRIVFIVAGIVALLFVISFIIKLFRK